MLINHTNDQHSKMPLKVQHWYSYIGSNHSCVIRCMVHSTGGKAPYWILTLWILKENSLLPPTF